MEYETAFKIRFSDGLVQFVRPHSAPDTVHVVAWSFGGGTHKSDPEPVDDLLRRFVEFMTTDIKPAI